MCRCANEMSSLNMDDDYEPGNIATIQLCCVALFIVQNNSEQVKTDNDQEVIVTLSNSQIVKLP